MSVTQTSIKAGSLPKSGWAVALLAGTILGGVALGTPAYAQLIANARKAGRAIAAADGYIAAIAAAHGFAVATRDISPFEAAGTIVINPWQA